MILFAMGKTSATVKENEGEEDVMIMSERINLFGLIIVFSVMNYS